MIFCTREDLGTLLRVYGMIFREQILDLIYDIEILEI